MYETLCKITRYAFIVCYARQHKPHLHRNKISHCVVHGLFGFDSILGLTISIMCLQRWPKTALGVFVTSVPAANSSEVRSEQLLQEVQQILAITGERYLIGHSQVPQPRVMWRLLHRTWLRRLPLLAELTGNTRCRCDARYCAWRLFLRICDFFCGQCLWT